MHNKSIDYILESEMVYMISHKTFASVSNIISVTQMTASVT